MERENIKKEIIDRIFEAMLSQTGLTDPMAIRDMAERTIDMFESQGRAMLSAEEKDSILKEIEDEILGLGPIEQFVKDDTVTEIMINGHDRIYIERNGKKSLSDARLRDERHLRSIIEKLLASTRRRVDELNPYVDISLPGGSRVNIVIPPASPRWPVVTIRKFLKSLNTIEDLVYRGSLDKRMAAFLINSVKSKANIIFSGATGSGKTTTLNILSQYIPEWERIVTIEDTLELRLKQEHVVPLETRQTNIEGKGEITIRDLFINSLRMRPDRIILGEIRHKEAMDLLQAIASGHTGSLAVLHGSSPHDAISRLEMMILTGGVNIPLWALRNLITTSVDLVVQHEQLPDGTRKITNITEVVGVENEKIVLKDIFYFDFHKLDEKGEVKGVFKCMGVIPSFMEKFKRSGIDVKADFFTKD